MTRRILQKGTEKILSAMMPFLTPPEFKDQELSAIARLQLQFIVPLMFLTPLFAAVAMVTAPAFTRRWLFLVVYIWLVGISTFALIRRRKPRLAGYLLLTEFWLIITAFTVTGGGIKAAIVVGYLVLVVGAGLLLGARAGYIMASVSIITELGLVLLARVVTIPEVPLPRSGLEIWIIGSFQIALMAILQHVVSHNFVSTLHRLDQELTEKKSTELSLRQSEERYSRLSQATFEGIIVSEHGKIVDVNNQALKLFGCSLADMIGKDILEFVGPGGTRTELHRITSENGEPSDQSATRLDGTTFPAETRSRSLVLDGHDMKLTTIRDITERRSAEFLQNAVYRISQAQNKSANLEDLYRAVHQIISTVMPANNFYIALYDRKEDMVSFPYFIDEKDDSFEPHKAGKGLTEYVIRTGKSLMCDEATDRELSERGEIELVGTQSTIWIGVPLKVEGRTFGVMAIQHYTDRNAYGERDLKMLEYVSEQVARAIDRKRAEDASQRERILLRTLVDNLPTPICVINKESQRTLVNPAHLRQVRLATGRTDLTSEESILGKTDFDLYPKEQAEEYFTDIQTVIRYGKQILEKEEYQIDPDGRPHWELMSKIPMRDKNGQVIGLVGIGTDITERKLAEENLRQLNAFNEMLIQTFPFGIEIVDQEGRILFMSERMKRLLGRDAVGRVCWEVYSDNMSQCERCPLLRNITIGESDSFETAGLLNGRAFQINHTGLLYSGREAMLEVFQDVTENKKLQGQFLQAQKLEGLGNIAAGIAHDFNNILGVILGYAELLNDSGSQKPDSGLNAIVSSAQRGKSLVSQLLMFARKTETTFKTVRINDIVEEIEKLVSATFPKTIQIATTLSEDLTSVVADPNQLHQVLLNICVNARDAMPKGGTISVSTEIVTGQAVKKKHHDAAADKYVRLIVSDTGVGMDEETKARIFEPFFSTKDIGKGTGLGLSVVYGIVESHRGFIEVDSKVGEGTAVSIYIPVEERPEQPESLQKPMRKASGGTETILVIEDEEMLRQLVESILTSNGYTVITADDGESGVETFRTNRDRIAAVISDLGLPKLGGQEVVGTIKELDPKANIVIASGYIAPHSRTELENLGVKAFIQKPYMKQEILKAARYAIDH